MTYQILVKRQSPRKYEATLLSWPSLRSEAATKEEALTQIRAAIVEWLAGGEIIEMDIPGTAPVLASGYAETFGMFKDDPTFDEFIHEVNRYREARNKIEHNSE